MANKVKKTDAEWRAELTPMQYAVLREAATERPFTGEYEFCTDPGTYRCAGCGAELFDAGTKFDSGCGWPSFTQTKDESAVEERVDNAHGMLRTEVVCASCEGHLGHVFPDGPRPTGLRYCMNSAALKLAKKE